MAPIKITNKGHVVLSRGLEKLLTYVVFILFSVGVIALSFNFFKEELKCDNSTGVCLFTGTTITNEKTDQQRFTLNKIVSVEIVRKKSSSGKHKYYYKPTIRYTSGKSSYVHSVEIHASIYRKFSNYYKNPTKDFNAVYYNIWGFITIAGWLLFIFRRIIFKIKNNNDRKHFLEKRRRKKEKKNRNENTKEENNFQTEEI